MEREGFRQLITRSAGTFSNKWKQALPLTKKLRYHARRVDNDARWNFIQRNLSADDCRLVDIGCADGYFTNRAAEAGMVAIGFDRNTERLDFARKHCGFKPGLALMNWELKPDNAAWLPTSDVTFVMSIIYYWTKLYGEEIARDMMRMIARRTDKLVFEPSGEWFSDAHVTVHAKNLNTGGKHEARVKAGHRLYIDGEFPTGSYEIAVDSEDYGRSNPRTIEIGRSGRLLEPVSFLVEDGTLVLIVGTDGVDEERENQALLVYHSQWIRDTFGDSVEIMDSMVVPYMGHTRKDPLFVLDTSGCTEES